MSPAMMPLLDSMPPSKPTLKPLSRFDADPSLNFSVPTRPVAG